MVYILRNIIKKSSKYKPALITNTYNFSGNNLISIIIIIYQSLTQIRFNLSKQAENIQLFENMRLIFAKKTTVIFNENYAIYMKIKIGLRW